MSIQENREWLRNEFNLTAERAKEQGISLEEYVYFVKVYGEQLEEDLKAGWSDD